MNKETLEAMKKGADVLKGIHGKLCVTFRIPFAPPGPAPNPVLMAYSNVDKVDATMDEVRNQLELTNEISQAISDPAGMGIDVRIFDTFTGFLPADKADNPFSRRWTTRSWQTNWQSSSRRNSTSGWQVPKQHRSIHQPRRSLRVSLSPYPRSHKRITHSRIPVLQPKLRLRG